MQTNHEKKYDERAMSLVLETCLDDYEEVAVFTVRNKSFINFMQGRLCEITAEEASVSEGEFTAVTEKLKSLRDDQAEYEAFYRFVRKMRASLDNVASTYRAQCKAAIICSLENSLSLNT
ncbi:MAG: hypothetical protein V3V31_01585 [Methylococcales bacterium]